MACSRDPAENLAKAEWRIREAAGRGAQIICLQELFLSQYFCREEDAHLFDLAESIPGPTTEALSAATLMARCGRFRLRNPIQPGLPSERGGILRRSHTRLPHGSGWHCMHRGNMSSTS